MAQQLCWIKEQTHFFALFSHEPSRNHACLCRDGGKYGGERRMAAISNRFPLFSRNFGKWSRPIAGSALLPNGY